MTTRRERMENRQARREEWAAQATARAEARFGAAGSVADGIPLGQPILVGHHSERRARRDADRSHANMHRGCEEVAKAKDHAGKAAGIASALDRAIFSDDADAAARLRERIAETEARVATYKANNAAWRKSKGDVDAMIAAGLSPSTARLIGVIMDASPWETRPHTFELTNANARIRADRKRLAEIADLNDPRR